MLITNNYSTNVYKSNNISKPIKNTFAFRGVDNDSVEISTKNKKLSPEEKTVANLMDLGFDKEDAENYVDSIKNNFVDVKETCNYLTKDVPNFEDKNIQKEFIEKRLVASAQSAYSSDSNQPKLSIDKDRFKFFSNTVTKYPSLHNKEALESLYEVTVGYNAKTLNKIDKFIDKDENAPLLLDSVRVLDFNKK